MKIGDTVKLAVLLIIMAAAVSFLLKFCHGQDSAGQGGQARPPAAVAPITDREELDKLPPLPGGEKPVAAIPVAVPTPRPGHVVKPSVVVSDAGNTYVVFSESIDWGLRIEPKASVAISTELLVGIDLSFFSYWRLNADALAYLPVVPGIDFEKSRAGIGVSFQATPNTSAGIACLWDFGGDRTFAAFAAVKL